MFDLWNTELTEDQETAMLEKMAVEIKRRKLEVGAILALEMHKPIANVAMHGAVAFSPFLIPFLGFENVNDYSRLLRKPQNVERLIVLLENEKKGSASSTAKEEAEVRQS